MKANSDLCEIVAFCDIIKERAEKGAAEYGAEGARIYDFHASSMALASAVLWAMGFSH